MSTKSVWKSVSWWVCGASVVAALAACNGGPGEPDPVPALSVSAEPAEIELWETSEISWTATDADSLSLLVDGVEVWSGTDASGSYTYSPDAAGTVVVTLVGENDRGNAEEQATVVVKELPPDFLEPLSFDIDLEGGNNNHAKFSIKVSFELDGTNLEISGQIPYVDYVPKRATIREGSFWAHFIAPGEIVTSYEVEGESDGPVDLSASLTLTWEQVAKLRNGEFYLEVDTDRTALGPILPSDELLEAGGQIQVHLAGLPPAETVSVRFATEYALIDFGPIEDIAVPGAVLTDLFYGEYTVEPEPYVDGAEEYEADVSPTTVTVGEGLLPEVNIVYDVP